MKKFNVKVLSMAVAAAVVSGAAAAEEVNFAQAVTEKNQGKAAFFTVFGEGTTFDKDTGKLTFKKDSDALLLKTLELEQTINGFASGSNFITTDANGNKTVREATNEDIEADSLKGVGLAGGLTAVNARVDDVNARVDDLLDDTEAALDEQEKAIEKLNNATKTNIDQITKITEGVNTLNTSVAEMGKDISTKFDEVDSEISKASSELSESIEKVSEDVTAVNTRVDSLAQDTADAKAAAKAAEDKVTELSANVDSKVKEAKDAADKAVDAASKIDAVADKADKASKGVAGLTEALEKVAEQSALAAAENTQALNGFAEGHEIVVTDADGIKSVKKATKEDVEQDEFGGLGLKEVVAQHDQSLADLTAETERAKKAAEQAAFAAIENAQELNGFKEKDEIIVTDDNGVKSVKTATEEDVKADEFKGLGLKEAVKDTHKAAAQATLAAIENAQELNGFQEGDQIVVTKDDGSKVIRTATKEDVENADFEGMGLKEVVAAHDETLDGLNKAVTENSEALVKTAAVVNDISADVNANKAAIETKADKTDFEELAKYTADMGKKVNDIGDEVTSLSDATTTAVARIDEDIVNLKKAGLTAADALEANRQDIDANKAAIGTKADKADFEELAKYTADMGKKVNDIGDEVTSLSDATTTAVARIDEDIVNLKKAGLTAADALEANRQDIDANKAAIAENTASLKEQEKANEGFNNAIASLDEDISTLKKVGLAAADALEVNRQDIDANKAAIDKKADKADFEELAKYTDNMGKKVNDIGDEVTALSDATSAAITRQDKDIVDLAKGLQLAAEAVEDNRKDIDANKADIEIAKKAAVEAEKSAKSVQGSVEVAKKSAETAESHAKAAQTSADAANNVASAAQTAAAQAQDAVKANASQVAANKADIATLQTASNQHAAGIAKNSARIDSLDKNVANLRKETRQGLAAQAALSGLFQPYSVGKFNVTAALGGFKSDTAVAVGAGYRFNENFAAKAGLAVGTSSGGSASYNVGVNYEW